MSSGLGRREPCAACGQPVFLAQRLVVERHLFHRTCFKCSRCGAQLSLASYQHLPSESRGRYCCETCPDEETDSQSEETSSDDHSANCQDGSPLEELSMPAEESKVPVHMTTKSQKDMSGFLRSQLPEDGPNAALLLSTPEPLCLSDSDNNNSDVLNSAVHLVDNETDVSGSAVSGEPVAPIPKERTPKHLTLVETSPTPAPRSKLVDVRDITVNNQSVSTSDVEGGPTPSNSENTSRQEFVSANDKEKHTATGIESETIAQVAPGPSIVPSSAKLAEEGSCESFEPTVSQNAPPGNIIREREDVVCQAVANSDTFTDLSLGGSKHGDEFECQQSPDTHTAESHKDGEVACIPNTNVGIINENTRDADVVGPEGNELDLSVCADDVKPSNSVEDVSHSVANPIVTHTDNIESDNVSGGDDAYPEELNPFTTDDEVVSSQKKISCNPFGSSSEDDEEVDKSREIRKKSCEKPPRPPPPAILVEALKGHSSGADQKKKIIPTSLNPFGSDDETDEEHSNLSTLEPSLGGQDPALSFHGSTSSLAGTQRRKKAPAPRPPAQHVFTSPPRENISSSSPQISPKSRKRRPAPPPPATSSPLVLPQSHHLLATCSPIISSMDHSRNSSVASFKKVISAAEFDEQDLEFTSLDDWEKRAAGEEDPDKQKMKNGVASSANSDETASLTSSDAASIVNKITSSRHRKGPAPAAPRIGMPGVSITMGALRRELALLEEQQRGLERQGVRLETLIRERTEGRDPIPEGTTDVETDELLLQLFDLVNEKNELFRRQAELMYLRKQQRLEEEQADLEQQVRVLMSVEESNKTDTDKQKEEALLTRLMDVVERRDLVIAALEQERLREKAEDQAIRERMTLHRAKLEEMSSLASTHTSKSEKKEKKRKKHWMKKDKMKKSDGETAASSERDAGNKGKHKKWFK